MPVGSAWATLTCYAAMAFVSYLLGRKYYPVAYNLKRILFYMSFGLLLYFARDPLLTSGFKSWQAATSLMLIYLFTTALFELRGIYKLKKTA